MFDESMMGDIFQDHLTSFKYNNTIANFCEKVSDQILKTKIRRAKLAKRKENVERASSTKKSKMSPSDQPKGKDGWKFDRLAPRYALDFYANVPVKAVVDTEGLSVTSSPTLDTSATVSQIDLFADSVRTLADPFKAAATEDIKIKAVVAALGDDRMAGAPIEIRIKSALRRFAKGKKSIWTCLEEPFEQNLTRQVVQNKWLLDCKQKSSATHTTGHNLWCCNLMRVVFSDFRPNISSNSPRLARTVVPDNEYTFKENLKNFFWCYAHFHGQVHSLNEYHFVINLLATLKAERVPFGSAFYLLFLIFETLIARIQCWTDDPVEVFGPSDVDSANTSGFQARVKTKPFPSAANTNLTAKVGLEEEVSRTLQVILTRASFGPEPSEMLSWKARPAFCTFAPSHTYAAWYHGTDKKQSSHNLQEPPPMNLGFGGWSSNFPTDIPQGQHGLNIDATDLPNGQSDEWNGFQPKVKVKEEGYPRQGTGADSVFQIRQAKTSHRLYVSDPTYGIVCSDMNPTNPVSYSDPSKCPRCCSNVITIKKAGFGLEVGAKVPCCFWYHKELPHSTGVTLTGDHLHPEARAHLKKMETKANIAKKKKGDREWNYRGLLD